MQSFKTNPLVSLSNLVCGRILSHHLAPLGLEDVCMCCYGNADASAEKWNILVSGCRWTLGEQSWTQPWRGSEDELLLQKDCGIKIKITDHRWRREETGFPRNYTSLWVRVFSCNFRQFLSTARGVNPGSTGMTPPERPDYGTVRMGLSWDLSAEAWTAPDRVGRVGWAMEGCLILFLTWVWVGKVWGQLIVAHTPYLCWKSKEIAKEQWSFRGKKTELLVVETSCINEGTKSQLSPFFKLKYCWFIILC